MKRAILGFALGLLLMTPATTLAAVKYPEHPADAGYVNDFAGVLSPSQKADLERDLRQFEHDTTAEIAVVTVTSLQGESIEDYANGLFRAWGIGKKGADNGVLFLQVTTGKHERRIEVGRRLEGILTDVQAKTILHEVVRPKYKSGDPGGAIVDGTEEIINLLTPTLKSDEGLQIQSHQETKPPSHFGSVIFIILIGVVAISGIALLVLPRKKRFQRPQSDSGYYPRAQTRSNSDFVTGMMVGQALNSHHNGPVADQPTIFTTDNEQTGGGSLDLGGSDNDSSGVDFGGGTSAGGGASDSDD